MNFFKKIQKLDIFWKKFLVVVVLFGVATSLGFFTIKNFQKRLREFNKGSFLKEINLPKVREELEKAPFSEVGEKMAGIESLMNELEKVIEKTTSTTSTNLQ